jgi:hypothetical protein
VGGIKWLKVQGSAGVIEPQGPQQFIYVTADTSQLGAGVYGGTLYIHSNADADISTDANANIHTPDANANANANADPDPDS